MCGICGVTGWVPDGAVERMATSLHHRGPDSGGFHKEESCHLGIRRLKIIDLEGSEQPIYSEDRRFVLVCNGEIYNYRALREQLSRRGHRFSTDGDVEVIVHLYEEYGEDCVTFIEGMFAFAVWDTRDKRIFLARDRLGVKPLYYVKHPNRFIFASEIRAVIASGLVEPVLDEVAVLRYTAYPAVPAPLTIFKHIRALLPGHSLRLDGSGMKLREYWDVDFAKAAKEQLSPEESLEAVREAVTDAVRMRLMSDVPLGAFLSGGIDSSAVVAVMGTLLDRPVRTFSIRFTGEDKSFQWFDDASFAQKVARRFRTDHTEEIVTGKEVFDNLADAVWAMDQPSGDAIQYYLVSKAAARHVTVALSGTGGDEVFAGYEWFKEIRTIEAVHQALAWLSPEKAQKWLRLFNKFRKGYQPNRLYRRIETILLGRFGFADRYRLNRRLYRGEDFFYIFSPDFITKIVDYPLDIEDMIDFYANRCEHLDPIAKMSYLQLKTDMVNLLIRDQDAVSMAHSLEVRLPLIDQKVVEIAARVPSSLKLKGNQEKYILRKALSHLLPEEITSRRKKGFIFPMSQWMRKELKPVVESCLNPEAVRRRGIFNPDTTTTMYRDFKNGKQPFFKIWNQVVFELWCRITIDRPDGWTRPGGSVKDFL